VVLAHEKLVNQKLEERIQAMESKLLCGGKNIIDHTNEQQRALEQRNQEIAERKVSFKLPTSPISPMYKYTDDEPDSYAQ
jgi:kinesin family protein 3/17